MSTPWHTLSTEEVFLKLGSSVRGLSAQEVGERRERFGQNALPEEKPQSALGLFLGQFKSPLIYVLFAAAAAVFLMGEVVDAAIIFVVLFFNAVVGAVQEGRAQSTLRALREYVTTNATVLRDGQEHIIPDTDVVPGDIILLREGEKVPADARVLSSQTLTVDEAPLTGESTPVHKVADAMEGEGLAAAERKNMLFRGTHAVSGFGSAVVVATGSQTMIGGIAKQVAAVETEIPLRANIRALSRLIIVVVGISCALIFGAGVALGHTAREMFAVAVSLSVSAIPEGLPIVMTLVLASGVWRMSKRNALVKKLQAVEALGQARIIAVDKTGTITKNELVVRRVWAGGDAFDVEGEGYEPKGAMLLGGAAVDAANHEDLLAACKAATLASSARVLYAEDKKEWRVTGDPTEAALIVLGEKAGFRRDDLLREEALLGEMPFDYRLKYHAVLAGGESRRIMSVVGAPETILSLCTHIRRGGEDHPFAHGERAALEREFAQMADGGLRVVAAASRKDAPARLTEETVHDLSFLGFFGMQDALRSEVPEAMERARGAGMRVVMITGDHAQTARAIAREVGIYREGDSVLTGTDIERMTEVQLSEAVGTTSVFARVTPEHKMAIINAYKRRGEIVAMTGDGVNDAPPLVAADLGIAMGKIGTEVAKEAADIVLLDDNFGSIVSAVEEGRGIYLTIKKVLLYLFSTSVGEVLVIVGALALGLPLPILASQIIWLNFVTDGFLDVALAMEPQEKGLLSRSFERPKKYLVDRLMAVRMAFMAAPMMIGTLILFSYYASGEYVKALTISLTVLAVFQWFNAWNCRSDNRSIFASGAFNNRYLMGATALVILLQLCAVYLPPLQAVLGTVPLGWRDWALVLPVAVSIVVVEESRKLAFRRMGWA